MSSHGGIIVYFIRNVAQLIETIKDLQLTYQQMENLKMQTTDGKIHNVEVIVKDENNRQIGFQKQNDGTYKIIADSTGLTAEQLKKQQMCINKIKQHYAYNVVIQELKKQGYQLVEEKKVEKNTLKLIARRWI
ncbi:MAG: DUF1257 domain-containing protein [bacterium]